MYALMFSGQKWVQCEIHFCDIIHTQIFTFFGACFNHWVAFCDPDCTLSSLGGGEEIE